MVNEITELDMKKYLVWKWEDIRELPIDVKEKVAFVEGYIGAERHKKGKKDNSYLALDLDEEIDMIQLRYLLFQAKFYTKIQKVSDIAVALVNAILKAKEKE